MCENVWSGPNVTRIDCPQGKPWILFPRDPQCSRGRSRGKPLLRVEGNQNSLFLVGPVIKGFVILPNSKVEQTAKTTFDAAWHTNFRCFKDAITCESKVQVILFS